MKKVSYQGVQGAYSQSAAKKFFGEEIDTIGTNSFEDALNYAIYPSELSKRLTEF